jgi:hypothetical protein
MPRWAITEREGSLISLVNFGFVRAKKHLDQAIQRMLRCSMKTAWFLGHGIRETMNDNPAK